MFQIFSYLRYIKDTIIAFDFNDIDDTINNGSLIIISDLINKLNKQIYNDCM